MSQISPPIRIVLIAAIGLIAVWMLFLRPKAEPAAGPANTPGATAPGVKGLSNAVDKAEDAAAKQEARDEKLQKATGDEAAGDAAKPGTPVTRVPSGRVLALAPLSADSTKDLPADIRGALKRRQVIAIAVLDTRHKRWAPMAADDRRVRRSVLKANRYRGTVLLTTATLGEVNKLDPIIGDLNVSQTPTVVVVDRNRKATLLTGFVDRPSINQAIADARRYTTEVRISDPYLRKLNETCANFDLRINRFALPTTRAGIKPALRRLSVLAASYRSAFAGLPGAGRHKALQGQVNRVMKNMDAAIAAYAAGNLAQGNQAFTTTMHASAGLDGRMEQAGVTGCVGNRTQ